MRLFTCKKYDFLIEKNLPSLSAPPPKIRERRKFHRGFVVIPTDLSSDPSIWWGGVMLESNTLISYSPKLSTVELTLN